MPEPTTGPDSPDVARVRRWEDFGGTWRVLALSGASTTLSLCRCDGGEEADRITSSDPGLLALARSAADEG